RAKKILQTLAGYYKDTHFHIWLSLDGVKKQLDAMRGGAPHSFETLLRTYQNLRQISFTNFTVGFQVLISKFNINTAPQLIEDVFMLYPDIVSLDVAFGSDALDVIALNVTPEYERVTEIIKMYLDRLRKLRGPASIRFLKQYLMRRTGIISRNLKYGERVGKCFAGHASLYVDPAGSVKDCPVAGRELGDLSECEYDIERILKSATAKKVREQVNVSGCFCTMSSPSLSNVFLSPSEYLGIACSTL
ncbi:MAG TPA: hypothetical protein PLQ76_07220, partial [bacterium]|nr:hypothetical protein [bacterium]